MAKDSEKLIRQLSLIAFLTVEARPVPAIEIRQEVQGYAAIVSDEAFNRRFYADRRELASLGVVLEVEKSSEGPYEAEMYTLPREGLYLAIDPTDEELGLLNAVCFLLGPDFAYARPLGLVLERLSWVRPPARLGPKSLSRPIPKGSPALAKLDSAIHRRKRVKLDYRGVALEIEPYHLYYTDRFHLVGLLKGDDERIVVVCLPQIDGKVSYATKGERDFQVPEDFDPERLLGGPDLSLTLEPVAPSAATAGEHEDADASETGSGVVPDGLSRLLGLARLLLTAPGSRLDVEQICERMRITEAQLRSDLDLLSVVNFGSGNYVLYAEISDAVVEVDPGVHAGCLARPMRILPLEARALLAAIDLAREGAGGGVLRSLRARVVDALGGEPPGLRIVPPTAVRRSASDRPATPDLMAGLSAARAGGRSGEKGGVPCALHIHRNEGPHRQIGGGALRFIDTNSEVQEQ